MKSCKIGESNWYCIDNTGLAMLCADKDDAIENAELAAKAWPNNEPYRVVQKCKDCGKSTEQDLMHTCSPQVGAAIKTLVGMGYTYHGGEHWKPPLGRPSRFSGVVQQQAHGGAYEVIQKMFDALQNSLVTVQADAEAQHLTDGFKRRELHGDIVARRYEEALEAGRAWLTAAPEQSRAEPVGFNGLTEAETRATMSVMELSQPPAPEAA